MIPQTVRDLQRRARVITRQGTIPARRALAIDNEIWHVFGAPGEVGFSPGWADYGNGFVPASFRVDSSGFTNLRGLAYRPGSTDPTIAQLPDSWAPAVLTPLPFVWSGLATGEVSTLYVHTDGVLEIYPAPSNVQYAVLSSLTWKAKGF